MALNILKYYLIYLLFIVALCPVSGQGTVPPGIHYQAVARDNYGKELANKEIDIRFSIISANPLGPLEYEELHSKVVTSKYGVFSIVIGHGTPTGGTFNTFSQISWSSSAHFLKVEVKFESSFVDMGTMQFLAVPYALYAQKSLEPGPAGARGDIGPQGLQGLQGSAGSKGDTGPQGLKGDTGPQGQQGVQGQKGDQGDPATDDQTLSFDGTNISILGGNTVNLSPLMIPHQLTILGDTLSIFNGNKVGLPNQIQDLQLDANNKLKLTKNTTATEIDFTRFLDDKQQLTFNSVDNTLIISGGNNVDLTPMKQDLLLTGNILTITNKATTNPINLSTYLQTLEFNPADNKLSISGITPTVDLTSLKNDGDFNPLNEIQDLNLAANILKITNNTSATDINLAPYLDNTDNQTISYNPGTFTLSISGGGSATLGSIVAFRAKKNFATTATIPLSNIDFIPDEIEYNDGTNLDPLTGEFTTPFTGIYTFDIKYIAPNLANGQLVMIYKNGNPYETLGSGIGGGTTLFRTLTIKLIAGNKVKLVINTGVTVDIGTGSFSGFRVY